MRRAGCLVNSQSVSRLHLTHSVQVFGVSVSDIDGAQGQSHGSELRGQPGHGSQDSLEV